MKTMHVCTRRKGNYQMKTMVHKWGLGWRVVLEGKGEYHRVSNKHLTFDTIEASSITIFRPYHKCNQAVSIVSSTSSVTIIPIRTGSVSNWTDKLRNPAWFYILLPKQYLTLFGQSIVFMTWLKNWPRQNVFSSIFTQPNATVSQQLLWIATENNSLELI